MGYVALALAVAALWLSLLYSQLHKEHQRWRIAYLRLFQRLGTPPDGGYLRPSASITERERGTRTPATAISGECNLTSQRGTAPVGRSGLTWLALVNSYIEPGSTGVSRVGESVGLIPRERAV